MESIESSHAHMIQTILFENNESLIQNMNQPIQISPSLLAADVSKLAQEIDDVLKAGADRLHFDIMDGHFVPNLTFGPQMVKALRSLTDIPFDVHLMVERPDFWIPLFAKAGADSLTIHPETTHHLHRTLALIQKEQKKVGLALNPATSLTCMDYVYEYLDIILVMTVNPGFGGQRFIPEQIQKIQDLRTQIDSNKYNIEIHVDGGINTETGPLCLDAGAQTLIAGTAVFDTHDYKQNIQKLRNFPEKI